MSVPHFLMLDVVAPGTPRIVPSSVPITCPRPASPAPCRTALPSSLSHGSILPGSRFPLTHCRSLQISAHPEPARSLTPPLIQTLTVVGNQTQGPLDQPTPGQRHDSSPSYSDLEFQRHRPSGLNLSPWHCRGGLESGRGWRPLPLANSSPLQTTAKQHSIQARGLSAHPDCRLVFHSEAPRKP